LIDPGKKFSGKSPSNFFRLINSYLYKRKKQADWKATCVCFRSHWPL